jgi:hypothetical protein
MSDFVNPLDLLHALQLQEQQSEEGSAGPEQSEDVAPAGPPAQPPVESAPAAQPVRKTALSRLARVRAARRNSTGIASAASSPQAAHHGPDPAASSVVSVPTPADTTIATATASAAVPGTRDNAGAPPADSGGAVAAANAVAVERPIFLQPGFVSEQLSELTGLPPSGSDGWPSVARTAAPPAAWLLGASSTVAGDPQAGEAGGAGNWLGDGSANGSISWLWPAAGHDGAATVGVRDADANDTARADAMARQQGPGAVLEEARLQQQQQQQEQQEATLAQKEANLKAQQAVRCENHLSPALPHHAC